MQCRVCGQDNPPEARFCANCGSSLVTTIEPPAPTVKPSAEPAPPAPGVGSSYSHAWRQLWKHFWVLLLIAILYLLISYVSLVFRWAPAGLFSLLSLAYLILLAYPISCGVAYAYLKAARDDPVEVKDMFEVFRNYWNVVLAIFLVGAIVFTGFLLLIVPGIIFACKLAFTPYLVVDRKMAFIEAIKGSWRMTGGHSWKVFLIGLLAIPIYIAGWICFGVGIILAGMWVGLALAALYHAVSNLGEASSQPGNVS